MLPEYVFEMPISLHTMEAFLYLESWCNMYKNKICMDLDVNLNKINSVLLKQYNQNSQWLIIKIFENGKPFFISEQDKCIFKMVTPDKREIYNDSIFTENTVIVEITKNCCTDAGTGQAELDIIDKEKNAQIASFNFNIVIEESVFDNENIEGSNEYGALADRIIAADKAIENAEIATDNATTAAENANAATKDLQDKLDSHHFVLTEDKDIANGVPSLDEHVKVPISELYDATTTQKGITQLTDSVTSTSTTTSATPNSVKMVNDSVIAECERAIESEENLESKKANISSPTFTGIPKAPTASAGTSTNQIATTEFVQISVSNGIAASDAMIIKGTIGHDAETGIHGTVDALPATYKTGWTYRVVADGTYAGQVCEIGDLIIALVDRNGYDNMDSDWCIAQTNINGAITRIKNGDAYIECSQSGSVITIKHKDVPRSNTTSTASPSNGGNFIAVKSVTSDSKGHVTSVDTETVTLPNTYVHPTTPGNKHIPSGGKAGQILRYSSDGTAIWSDENETQSNTTVSMDAAIILTTQWTDIMSGTELPTGTYIICVTTESDGKDGLWSESYVGLMHWYSGITNSTESDEILLHSSGHAANSNRIYLRTKRNTDGGSLSLQISFSKDTVSAINLSFNFIKIL